ncbi:MAG: DUF1499 domain-containing protein [Deltaproteobacteria bacterium]|nr:DUF1499 domain-containing protein [Deltaproteobacteria bacterium]
MGGLGCAAPGLGVKDGRLSPCPGSPNCVSSQDTGKSHHIDPITYTCSAADARKALDLVLESMPACKIVSDSDSYIHATFKSRFFRFTDDVEFYFPKESGLIHVRSASRTGYSDLGVNRKRIEKIRKLFAGRVRTP